jgi:tetraacyldisaccharide 4'-kinase
MQPHHRIFNPILYLLSLFYGLGVYVRNFLFDYHFLPTTKFDIPVIGVGNISVGGTGKTPHTEYILQYLSERLRIAVLSRGYKRKTKGFQLGDEYATAETIGDEPFQMKWKFPNVLVAVDANRRRGIEYIIRQNTEHPIEAIVLDDAYQHRYVEPSLNILIVDRNRLITEDSLLPYGRLREQAYNKYRANIVIVSKCDRDLQPIDYNVIKKKLALFPYQTIYFTTYGYGSFYPLFPQQENAVSLTKEELCSLSLLMVTGIALPVNMHEYLQMYCPKLSSLEFPDHYEFKNKDYSKIAKEFANLEGEKRIVVTEKDAARLLNNPLLPEELKPYIYVLPIKVEFINNQEPLFNRQILSYVNKD